MSDGERTNRPTDRELEDLLREIGSKTRYPQTPDISDSVRSRLQSEARPSVRRRGWLQSPVTRVAAALVLVLILAVPAIPIMREYLAADQSGGAASSDGEAMQSAPSRSGDQAAESDTADSAGSAARSPVAPLGQEFDGERISPSQARERIGGPVPTLRPNGETSRPAEIYASGDSVALIYDANPRLPEIGETGVGAVILVSPDRDARTYLNGVSEEDYRETEVGGRPGYWFPDASDLYPTGGTTIPSASALIWERDDETLILGTSLPESRAVALAEMVR